MSLKALSFLSLIFFVSIQVNSQQLLTDKLEITTGNGTETKGAVVYLPANFLASKKYPLLIYSHGLNEAGTDITKLYTTGLPKILKDGYKPAFDFIMVAVQSSSYSVSPNWLPSILEWSQKKWNIDTNRLYLSGISAGGWSAYGSQLNISPQFAGKFAAIVTISGATQNSNTANYNWWSASKTPLWAIVGAEDKSYVTQNTNVVNEVNKRVPLLATLTVRSGVGHSAWNDVYKGTVKNGGKNIWEWMYQFNRAASSFPQAATTTSNAALLNTTNTGSKIINVNLFGGVDPYNNAAWNNWNISASLTAETFTYSDGTSSTVSAVLSNSSTLIDNGNTYGGGVAPAEVLRHTSSYNATRTLNIRGLSSDKTYTIDLFGSRNANSGITTLFTINASSQSIATYKNLTQKASFTNIAPAADGQIVVTIDKGSTYNYFNGFTITENLTSETPPDPVPAFANHTLPATGGYVNYANGIPISNLKPGDTINVMAGTYTALIFGNFKGDASRPIVIRNKGGQVKTEEIRLVNDAQYFKILGNGHSSTPYGFKIYRTVYSGINVTKARDFEIGHCEVYGMNVGIFIKNNPVSTDASTIYPNYVFKNIYLHHNYVHNIKKEGLYIGHSDPDGGQDGNPLIPVRHESIEIAYNIVDQTGWDGIQLGNARTGNKIHHNTVTNYGTLNASGQRSGIEIGTNTNADIYDNTLKNGPGTGIMVFGFGFMKVYNNVLENCGSSHSIYANPYIAGPEVNAKQQMHIYNNTVRYPKPDGAIKVGGLSTNSLPSTIENNKLLIVNPPSNWQKIHCYSVVAGSIITGNTLITQ